jgi:hypothetical protein
MKDNSACKSFHRVSVSSRTIWRVGQVGQVGQAAFGLAVIACGGHSEPAHQYPYPSPAAGRDASSQYPFLVLDAGHASCPEGGPGTSDGGAAREAGACIPSRLVSYSSDVIPIFAGNCNGEVCHNATWGGSSAAEFLVNIRAPECCDGRLLVRPGDPDHSYLVQKLRGGDLCMGRKMPLDHTLSDANVSTLIDWVCEGAPH